MTNEELIDNIISEIVIFGNEISVDALRYALSLMAKQKDQQFRECLEDKLSQEHLDWNGYECQGAITIIREIIKELFLHQNEIQKEIMQTDANSDKIKNLIGKTLSIRDTQECHNCDTVIANIQFENDCYEFMDDKNELIAGIESKDIDEFVSNHKISYTYYYSDRKCNVTLYIN